jgi:hypothetical protein
MVDHRDREASHDTEGDSDDWGTKVVAVNLLALCPDQSNASALKILGIQPPGYYLHRKNITVTSQLVAKAIRKLQALVDETVLEFIRQRVDGARGDMTALFNPPAPTSTNVFTYLLTHGDDEDFVPSLGDSQRRKRSDAPAGSKAKIDLLAERVLKGEELFDTDDRKEYDVPGRKKAIWD